MNRWVAFLLLVTSMIVPVEVAAQGAAETEAFNPDETVVRYIRAYGGSNELSPPIVLLSGNSTAAGIGSSVATVEFDISAPIIPNVYAQIVHCNADWSEDGNGFLTSVMQRTSLIDWIPAPQRARYYAYRGKLQIPNPQLELRFSGNWKVKIYDMDSDRLLAETRVFVVDQQAFLRLQFMTDFYEPTARVSSTALTLEAIVDAPRTSLLDGFQHTVVFYRNHRWAEPYVVSAKYREDVTRDQAGTAVRGFFPNAKIFRLSRVPAQNEYRVLDLTNLAMFPNTGEAVRLPLSDQRRNGMFDRRSNDGALVTTMVPTAYDEYVPLEFVLDPAPGYPSLDDVFVVGSFNNWTASPAWMLRFDERQGRYRLRQWVRRGMHDYLYATGRVDLQQNTVQRLSYEEWEGNTASASTSWIAFAYYTMQDYGGYDGLIAVGASNIYQGGR